MDELLETVTDTPNMHDQFRVWITTEVHPAFPISLLQVNYRPRLQIQYVPIYFSVDKSI